jgi:hypothetical protein
MGIQAGRYINPIFSEWGYNFIMFKNIYLHSQQPSPEKAELVREIKQAVSRSFPTYRVFL